MPDAAHPSHRRVVDAAARQGVAIHVVTFDQSTHTAQEAADALGAELGQIVKSLVFVAPEAAHDAATVAEGDGVTVVALVSGANRVDVARLAGVVELPTLRRATAREAADATGFSIGGIPPFGHVRPVRVVMDPDLDRYGTVWAAAGTPTAVFAIAPAELRRLSGALVAPLAQAPA